MSFLHKFASHRTRINRIEGLQSENGNLVSKEFKEHNGMLMAKYTEEKLILLKEWVR